MIRVKIVNGRIKQLIERENAPNANPIISPFSVSSRVIIFK